MRAALSIAAFWPLLAAHAWRNGAARLPPLAWANWNLYGCGNENFTHDDASWRAMADAFVSTGLAGPSGPWRGAVMHIEECIVPRGARDPVSHVLQPNATRWPHGLAALAEYFHGLGLRAGIYTDVAAETCAGFEGSGPGGDDAVGHWPLDALTFSKWGFDMIEADFCNAGGDTQTMYTAARDAIAAASAAAGREMLFYMCDWGSDAAWLWGGAVANLLRNTGDICSPGRIDWDDVLSNFDNTLNNSGTPPRSPGLPGTGSGGWNDPVRALPFPLLPSHGRLTHSLRPAHSRLLARPRTCSARACPA